MTIQIPRFADARLLVLGDLMLDRYWSGLVDRISPEAPVPVVKVEHLEERVGGAGNVALNIASLSGHATVMGLIGADEAAERLMQLLVSPLVKRVIQTVPSHPTITKLRVLSRQQQLLRLDFETKFAASDAAELLADFKTHLDAVQAVVLSDYGKGVLSDPQLFIQEALLKGVPVLVDPKGQDFYCYRKATLLTPNFAEFEAVVGCCEDENTLVSRGLALMTELELEALLITRSERGMTLLQRTRPPVHMPAKAQEVFDVTGAGDTVIAVLATALAAGSDLENAAILANMAAGLVVARLGTATVTLAELRQGVRQDALAHRGILTHDELVLQVTKAQARGERVVFTNGCFDLLHPGHVSYLRAAKKLGDWLVVAVNDDASVRALKGSARPINTLAHRMDMLVGLDSVDWVVPFAELTPKHLIQQVAPDVLVKGGDYQLADIQGAESVLACGGTVKVLNFEQGYSTTQIVDTILSTCSSTCR